MRALLLVLAGFTPAWAAERLTDAQLLARLDDATAAEARWLVGAPGLVLDTAGRGGDKTREPIAYKRLVRAGKPEVFELLLRAERGATVSYGIAGLNELAPARINDHWADLAVRVEPVYEMSGGTGRIDSPCGYALREIKKEHIDLNRVKGAWELFLAALEANVGRHVDDATVWAFAQVLGELPVSEAGAYDYVLALQAPDETSALRKLAAGDESVSRRLALQHLADWAYPPDVRDTCEVVWSRNLDEDAVLNLQIEATYWELLSGGRRDLDWGPISVRERPAELWTAADWEWLANHEDVRVRAAASELRANVMASWNVGDDLPQQPGDRQAALNILVSTATVQKGNLRPAARRAKQVLLKLFRAQPELLMQVGSRAFHAALSSRMNFTEWRDEYLPVAREEDAELFLFGMQLAYEAVAEDKGELSRLQQVDDFHEILKRMWKECEADTPHKWAFRELTARLLSRYPKLHNEFRRSVDAIAKWFREFAREYANPRAVRTWEMDHENFWINIAYEGEGRPHSLVIAIKEGRDAFLPADHKSAIEIKQGPDEVRQLYARVQEAVGKLD